MSRRSLFLSLAAQVFTAIFLAFLWEQVAGALGWSDFTRPAIVRNAAQVFDALMIAALGFCTGWSIVRLFPGAARAGRWVWLPPAALFSLLFVSDVFATRLDWYRISAKYFWSYPGRKLGPLDRDFLTYPALCAIAWSRGVLVRLRKLD